MDEVDATGTSGAGCAKTGDCGGMNEGFCVVVGPWLVAGLSVDAASVAASVEAGVGAIIGTGKYIIVLNETVTFSSLVPS